MKKLVSIEEKIAYLEALQDVIEYVEGQFTYNEYANWNEHREEKLASGESEPDWEVSYYKSQKRRYQALLKILEFLEKQS